MADIKQAAKWIQEGKRVRRSSMPHGLSVGTKLGCWLRFYDNGLLRITQPAAPLVATDLLADDWEIAE